MIHYLNYENWPGFKNYVIGFFGENSYATAMDELLSEGWISEGDTRYEWRKDYSPVGTLPKRKSYLKEWADGVNIFKDGGKNIITLDWTDAGTYPFEYEYGLNEIELGKQSNTHGSIDNEKWYDSKNTLQGRVWTKEKVLSVWSYPRTKSIYLNMIKKLNEKFDSY